MSSLNISSYRHNLGVSPNVESNTADSDCAEELRADEVTESKSVSIIFMFREPRTEVAIKCMYVILPTIL